MMEIKEIPYLTTDQMAEVDRLMVEVFGIHLIQMMENAGRQLAQLARNRFLEGDTVGKQVVLLAGSGGNGGGAMVCARHLHNWGADVTVVLSKAVQDLVGTIKHQGEILQLMDVEIGAIEDIKEKPQGDLIVDGIIGYSLQGAPRGEAAEMIRWANERKSPILALDLPSGLNATTGEVLEPTIRAAATMTLALPKAGLRRAGKNVVGELYLADIGVPPELYALAPLKMDIGPLFANKQILRLE
ncbi:MAG: NAD(P)H-hydrate epimerase [Anaerolineales bacterium]